MVSGHQSPKLGANATIASDRQESDHLCKQHFKYVNYFVIYWESGPSHLPGESGGTNGPQSNSGFMGPQVGF
jgi:hypothetical protein